MYKLDVARYIAHHETKLGCRPTSESIKSVGMIVEWCSRAYSQGQNRQPFVLPFDIPVIWQATNMQAIACLECGEVAINEVSSDKNGLHMICNHCNASIDIDLITDECDSEYMS